MTDQRKYVAIENEESEASPDAEVSFDGESVRVTLADGKHPPKGLNWNLELLKSAFETAIAHVTTGDDAGQSHAVQGINLSFSDLSYSVKHGLRRESKTILSNLHGEFLSGELTAIMGPSGAGKSTLMDVLAGYTTSGVEGSVKTNGVERDLRVFASQSCYIMQDDELCPLLTVQEALTLAAYLKLDPKIKGKQEKVQKLLESLGLHGCRKVMTGKLSGGQRKRLAIALELVSNPPVLFFDEPTSGLDSSTSKQCISLLKELAESGRTVVCTIHQPSASLFEMFDHVYAVRDGKCLYSGSTQGVVSFLGKHGLHCPHYHNPADFMLEIATMHEFAAEVTKLTTTIDDGRCATWRKRQLPETEKRLSTSEAAEEEEAKSTEAKGVAHRTYQTTMRKQFSILMVRNFKKISRDKFFTYLQLLVHVLFGLLIGLLFYNIGNDAAFVSDNFSLIFFCIMLNMFTSYSAAVSQYPQELPVLVREHFNKWYSFRAYYLAMTISGFPVQVCCTLLYTSIVYFMTAQPMEADRFAKSLSIVLLVAFVAQSFGYLIASTLNVQNASVFGALITAPFMLFSGYFVLIPDSPHSMKWLFHVSYFKYALEGVMIAVFGDKRSKMNCSEDYCHFVTPGKFLRQIGMETGDYWFNFGILLAIGLFLRVVTYYCLRFKIKYFRKYIFPLLHVLRTRLHLSSRKVCGYQTRLLQKNSQKKSLRRARPVMPSAQPKTDQTEATEARRPRELFGIARNPTIGEHGIVL